MIILLCWWVFFFFNKEKTKQRFTALLWKYHRPYSDLMSEVWLCLNVLFCLTLFEQNEENANRARKAQTHMDSKESKQNHKQAAVRDWGVWGGSEHIDQTNRLHAFALRAGGAAAAAVPEQSPPASRLWGATPESPYWSLEWAETHFLWAQVTWRKEQKRVEAYGHRMMRRRKTKKEVGCRWGNVLARDERRGGGGTKKWGIEKIKKGKKTKNYRRPIQAKAGLLRHSMLIEKWEAKIYAKHKSHTTKSHAGVRKNSLDSLKFNI